MIVRICVAVALVLLAVVVGSLGARALRRLLKNRSSAAVQDAADVVASGFFWVVVSVGVVLALSMTDPDQLRPIPTRLLSYFPRIVVAMLIVVAARVIGTLLSHAAVQAAQRATGTVNTGLGTAVQIAVLLGGAVLAVSQLGIDTTIVTILVAALAFGVSLAAALVVGLGGRRVASEVAAGRAMRDLLAPGSGVAGKGIEGTVVALGRVGVQLETQSGTIVHVPYERLLDDAIEITPAP